MAVSESIRGVTHAATTRTADAFNGEEEDRGVPQFRLVSDKLSTDCIACLRELLNQAESGYLVGFVFAANYRNRTFITDTAGECRRNPVFARGMVAELDDELSERTKR